MAIKKEKSSGGGDIPEWIVTFGDMMSLLLCFFILLAAFSELKKEEEYQRVVSGVKEAFGYSGGVGVLPSDDLPLRSMLQLMEAMSARQAKETRQSQSPEEGIKGKDSKVTKVQEGLMFTIGGQLTFSPGMADLKPGAHSELLRVANLIKGRRNKVSIRGHAAKKQLPEASPFDDLLDLSYYRAKAVADFLVREGGLDPEVVVIEALGDSEPVRQRAYSEAAQAANRRVEVIMTEVMIDDFQTGGGLTNENAARGETADQ